MHGVSFLLFRWWWCSAARSGGVRVCLSLIVDIGVGLLEAVLVPSTQILPGKLNIYDKIIQLTFVEKPNLKIDGMWFLCMTLVLFLFVDGDAVLPELAGSEFSSIQYTQSENKLPNVLVLKRQDHVLGWWTDGGSYTPTTDERNQASATNSFVESAAPQCKSMQWS